MDKAATKATEHTNWSKAAEAWKRFDAELVAWASPVTDKLIERLAPRQTQRILDLASGTGEPSLGIAERVGPLGSVLGIDFVDDMLAFAREKATRRALRNVEYRTGDCEKLDVPAESFDGASMRFGIMFFPDPVAAMKGVHRALKPGSRVSLASWAAADKNPWASVPVATLKKYVDIPPPPPGATGLFAFADPERIRSVLGESGFRDVKLEEVPNEIASFATGQAFADYIFTLSGPLAALLAKAPAEKRSDIVAEVGREVDAKFTVDERLRIPGSAWVIYATK